MSNIEDSKYKSLKHEIPLLTRNLYSTEIVALSGALSGFLAGIIVCPLDVAKTRLQAQDNKLSPSTSSSSSLKNNNINNIINQSHSSLTSSPYVRKYNGFLGTLKTIIKEENIKGLYKGLVPITLGYFPTWMIYFSIYEHCKKSPFYNTHLKKDYQLHSLSAMTAGLVSTTVTNPIWVVKTRLMLQIENVRPDLMEVRPVVIPNSNYTYSMNNGNRSNSNTQYTNKYNGTMDCFKKMYKYEGWRSFYKGLLPSFFGLFHVAIHFPLYERCKKILEINVKNKNINNYGTDSNNNKNNNNKKLSGNTSRENLIKLLLASCVSKMIASAITYPHEILRTRMQIKDSQSLIKTISKIYNTNGGLKGFYQGFFTNLIRTVPASTITLVSFEYFKNFITKHNVHLIE